MLDQVLKIEPKNEKALMRKCRVLVDIGGKDNFKQCESFIKILNEVAFDSAKSQAVYMEIKNIKENMEEKKSGVKKAPPKAKKPPKKNGCMKTAGYVPSKCSVHGDIECWAFPHAWREIDPTRHNQNS